MSWSISYSDIDGQKDDFNPSPLETYGSLSDEVREAFDAAVTAAVDLIKSRVLGVGVKYNVVLSGHANPGHAPVDGWVNDCMTISISQLSPAAPVAAPVEEIPPVAPTEDASVAIPLPAAPEPVPVEAI